MGIVEYCSGDRILRFDLSIPSRIDQITPVADFIASLVGFYAGSSEDVAYRIESGLRESMTNAITHGNKEDESKIVRIEGTVEKSGAVFYVSDQSEKEIFKDPANVRLPDDPLSFHGRGDFLILGHMDEYSVKPYYEAGRFAGNRACMVLRFNSTSS